MPCIRMNGAIITVANDPVTLTVGSTSVLFEWHEWHDWHGPMFCFKNGSERNAPPPRSPFWEALDLWIKQGRRIDNKRRCVWGPAKKKTIWVIDINKSNAMIVDEGTEDARPMLVDA